MDCGDATVDGCGIYLVICELARRCDVVLSAGWFLPILLHDINNFFANQYV